MDNASRKPIPGADAEALLSGRSPINFSTMLDFRSGPTSHPQSFEMGNCKNPAMSLNEGFPILGLLTFKVANWDSNQLLRSCGSFCVKATRRICTYLFTTAGSTPEEADADSVTCPISLMSFSTRFSTDISLLSLTPRFKYLQQSITEGLPRWEVLWFMESISAFNHDSRVSGCCRRSSARTWLIYLEHRPELPAEADAESTPCPISLMNVSTRFIFNVFSVSLPFFSETAMFKYLHTSLAEGLPSWELPSCKVSISAFNHASRAWGRWRCRSARTWLIYLEIIDDPAEAAEAEEAMASKENRMHTKINTWISPKRCWVSLTMSCTS